MNNNACYVSETSRHFSTRVRKHLLSDRSSNVFKHLQSSEFCRASCTPDCFEILDSAATKYQVKLKESMFIKWEKPDLNRQVKHIREFKQIATATSTTAAGSKKAPK